jgi:hypothetical protein
MTNKQAENPADAEAVAADDGVVGDNNRLFLVKRVEYGGL